MGLCWLSEIITVITVHSKIAGIVSAGKYFGKLKAMMLTWLVAMLRLLALFPVLRTFNILLNLLGQRNRNKIHLLMRISG